jgi:hypothetical protein
MNCRLLLGVSLVLCMCFAPPTLAAQGSAAAPAVATASHVFPSLINFSGVLKDSTGRTLTALTGVTFLLYKDEQGGAPLWVETQNITPDKAGRYNVQLGLASKNGIPPDLFTNGEARWLAVQIANEPEQARVLLVAVPYAMKSVDAQTLGGLPPSAFVLAAPPASRDTASSANPAASSASSPSAVPPSSPVSTTNGGTANTIAMFTGTADIENSILTQTNTTAINVNGKLNLPATGTATSAKGFNSQPQAFVASVFNSTTSTSVPQRFLWQAEPLNNDKTTATGTLNLLYAAGANAPAETGLKINPKGQFIFAPGQTYPGAGTVSSVGLSAPASDFTVSGSPVTKSGTLALKWNVAPTSLNTPNTIMKRDASGNTSANVISAAVVNATNSTLNGTLTVGAGANITNAGGVAIVASTSSANVAIKGTSTGTNAVSDGVDGIANSATASGVAGINNGLGVGVFGTGGTGVFGVVPDVIIGNRGTTGVFGQHGSASSIASNPPADFSTGIGVWGDGGSQSVGVAGSSDEGLAGLFENNASNAGAITVLIAAETSSTSPLLALNDANGTHCEIDANGNLNCTGTKNAVVPLDGGKRKVALSAIESPENWFEDFGSSQLVNGVAIVQLDQDFIQTVNTEKNYRVFPVPTGDCKGLYVTNKTASSFEVRELGGGTSNVSFDYRITAIRRKYEKVRFADHTNDPDPRKMLQRIHKNNRTQSRLPAPTKLTPAGLGVPVAERINK